MDVLTARYNMVTQQIQPLGVLNPKILRTLEATSREKFVPTAYQNIAYADCNVPIGNGRVLLAPHIIGRMLQALNLQGTEEVLEIETGTGYLTALLAQLSMHVTSLESNKVLAAQANQILLSMGIHKYEIITGNAISVLKGTRGFDVVVLTGSVPVLPKIFAQHVNLGGRIFAVIGRAPLMHACIFTRLNEENWSKTILFETEIPSLRETTDVTVFEF